MAVYAGNIRTPNKIVGALEHDKSIKLFCYSGKFYLYEDNYYKEIANMESRIYEYISNKETISSSMVKETIAIMRMNPYFLLDENRYEIEPERYINFNNGILDLQERKLIPHKPDIILLSKIPFDYNPDAQTDIITEKLIENFIKADTQEEAYRKRRMLFEYLGVVISNVRGLKHFLFIQGVKDTGKSTYCGLIMRILGSKNYSNLPLTYLTEGDFYLHKLIGKKANILTETDDTPIKDITALKKLTGGKNEKIICKLKGLNTVYEITPKTMLIFAGNTIPPIWNNGDKTAFVERMIPVTFDSPIAESEKIPNILDKINVEYIIKEAIDSLYGFLDNNMVFTQPAQSKKLRRSILEASDIIHAFVGECDTSNSESTVHTKTLYEIFKLWAVENGYFADKITSNTLTRRLKEMGFKGGKYSINGSCSLAGFKGIIPPKREDLGYWSNANVSEKL